MATRERGNPIGDTGRTVGENVRRVRVDAGVTQAELAERLKALGQPVPVASIGRIESGDRRVEVDDLVALALALNVGPLALLLPYEREPASATSITGAGPAHALAVWQWGTAGVPLGSLEGSVEDMEEAVGYAIGASKPWWLSAPVASIASMTQDDRRVSKAIHDRQWLDRESRAARLDDAPDFPGLVFDEGKDHGEHQTKA